MEQQDRLILLGGEEMRTQLAAALAGAFRVDCLADPRQAATLVNKEPCAAIILDGILPADKSSDIETALRQSAGGVPIILVNAAGAVEGAGLTAACAIPSAPANDWARVGQIIGLNVKLQDATRENALLRQVVENVSDCILTVDGNARITLTNAAVARTFGYERNQIVGKSLEVLFPPERSDAMREEMLGALRGGSPWSGELTAVRGDGTGFPIHVGLSFTRNADGAAQSAIILARDESNLHRLVGQLKQLSIKDDLTGVYNVRYFWARLNYEVARSRRYHQPLACLMLDLDHFKAVNDAYGHRAGDDVLSAVGQAITTVVREVDIVARYGGEEFALILPSTDAAGAMRCAEHVRESVAASETVTGKDKIHVTVSIGTAMFTPEVVDAEGLVQRADAALLEAKRRGRNRVFAHGESSPSAPQPDPSGAQKR